ncbi:MAG: DoxX family membrane protein [Dehalococcoidia bacterium]|nr:DoxX family membrane protein [Dehalococcoidia bacterium]
MSTPLRLVPLRVITGSTLAVHGFARLFGGPGTRVPEQAQEYLGPEYQEWMENGGIDRLAQRLEAMGVSNPRSVAYAIAGGEFFGGVLLTLGLFTPLAGMALAAELGASIKRLHWDQGMAGSDGWEVPALLLASVVTILINEP